MYMHRQRQSVQSALRLFELVLSKAKESQMSIAVPWTKCFHIWSTYILNCSRCIAAHHKDSPVPLSNTGSAGISQYNAADATKNSRQTVSLDCGSDLLTARCDDKLGLCLHSALNGLTSDGRRPLHVLIGWVSAWANQSCRGNAELSLCTEMQDRVEFC